MTMKFPSRLLWYEKSEKIILQKKTERFISKKKIAEQRGWAYLNKYLSILTGVFFTVCIHMYMYIDEGNESEGMNSE